MSYEDSERKESKTDNDRNEDTESVAGTNFQFQSGARIRSIQQEQ